MGRHKNLNGRGYSEDWDDPATIRAFLKKRPPTMMACSLLFADMAEYAETPLGAAWFLAAAAFLKSHAKEA